MKTKPPASVVVGLVVVVDESVTVEVAAAAVEDVVGSWFCA